MSKVLRASVALLALCSLQPTGRASPVGAVETINAIATSDAPWERFFPNVYDPLFPKVLRFEGVATVGGTPSGPLPATLWVEFDWLDPLLGVMYSPAMSFPVSYTPALTLIDISYTIPFCPPQVSLHFSTDAPPGAVVNISGQFTHECLCPPVPDHLGSLPALVLALGWLSTRPGRRA